MRPDLLAVVAGVAAVLATYLALTEWERVRDVRRTRALLATTPRRRRSLPNLGSVWSEATAGEAPVRTIQLFGALALGLFAVGIGLRSLTLTLAAGAVGVVAGYMWTQRQRWTLSARVARQLPSAMSVMADALSAGATLFESIERAAHETSAPLGILLTRAVARLQINVTPEEALQALAAEIRTRDVDALVVALTIHRTLGGNLARLLRESAAFLREEQRLTAEARALSAQARYSAQVIGVLPVALLIMFATMFPSFIEPLTTTSVGLLILAYALVSSALGFYVIRRIALRIERV